MRLHREAMLALCALFTATSALAAPSAQPGAHRTSGVAPLFVFFDAEASDCDGDGTTNEWADDLIACQYEWQFGDPGSGTWTYSGASRNQQLGPYAGHVFEEPGSYTVALTARNAAGQISSKSIVIQVTAPAASTGVCLSRDSDFTGCPTGFDRVTDTGSFEAVIDRRLNAGDRHILLKAGQTWTSSSTQGIGNAGPGTIGAFGTANAGRFIVNMTAKDVPVLRMAAADWRIVDMQAGGAEADVIEGNNKADDLTVYRLKTTRVAQPVSFDTEEVSGQLAMQTGVAVVDGHFTDYLSGSGPAMWIGLQESALLGNFVDLDARREHSLRVHYFDRLVLAHNKLLDGAPTKHELKVHNRVPTAHGIQKTASRLFVQENYFQDTIPGDGPNWTTVFQAQNDNAPEPGKELLIERNYFAESMGGQLNMHIRIAYDDAVIRNNVFNCTNNSDRNIWCVSYSSMSGETPTNGQAYANTCYRESSTQTTECIRFDAGSGHRSQNNLMVAPGDPEPGVGTCTGCSVNSGNKTAGTGVFAPSGAFDSIADFGLAAGASSLINVGSNTPGLVSDGRGNCRSGTPDVGALESGTGPCSGGTSPPPPPPPTPRLDPPSLQ